MVKILYCGNLGLGHELETIIYAVHRLDHEVNLKLVFAGNGKAKDYLKKLTRHLQLENIEFASPVPLYQLSDLLASGDIHFISQKMGTQGLLVPSKIYGILSIGRPVLFIGPFDCEVASIIVRSGAGIIVQPGDIDGVVKALKCLILNQDIRMAMGLNGKEYYKKYFGRERSVSRIIKVIESLK